MTAPSREAFDRWKEDFVTRWVMGACRKAASDCEQLWTESTWVQGAPNPANDAKTMSMLRELRTRADAYLGFAGLTYEAACDLNGDEPETA